MKSVVEVEVVGRKIILLRGQKVILDVDLAELYGVTTKRLNEQVKRNISRFPRDFMFQLTESEMKAMRSQSVTASNSAIRSQNATASKRNVRYLPFAFTEHGAIMVASVLNTKRAIDISVYVVRAFIKLRRILSENKELADKLRELERKGETHDGAIRSLVSAIRQLMKQPEPKEKKIGLIARERGAVYRTARRK